MADQPFWGERMHRLGLAPAPVPQATLTAGQLTAAIRTAVTDGLMRQRAETVGHLVRAEEGVAAAAAILEQAGRRSPLDRLVHS
jgi:sterol 3beta-glucosyltransferase